jgi:hypothetical protein
MDTASAASRPPPPAFDIRAFLAYISSGVLLISFVLGNFYLLELCKEWIEGVVGTLGHAQVLAAITVGILALPLGIMVNALSFFFMDFAVRSLEERKYRREGRFFSVLEPEASAEIIRYFEIATGREFLEKAHRAVELLKIFSDAVYRSYHHIPGLGIFLRVSSFLCLAQAVLFAIYALWFHNAGYGGLMVAFGVTAYLLLYLSAHLYIFLHWNLLYASSLLAKHRFGVPGGGSEVGGRQLPAFDLFLDCLAQQKTVSELKSPPTEKERGNRY